MDKEPPRTKAKVYRRYPKANILIYNGSTAAHFILGGLGIFLGYGYTLVAILFGVVYLSFAFGEMYLVMPFKVCPNCPYYRMKDSLCVSGMNVVSRKLAGEGNPKDFKKRAEGLLCPNNLYMASLMIPIIAMIPALIFDFSFLLLVIFAAVVALLLFRFFVIFMKIACIHCAAKYVCPQAGQMGVREM